MTDLDDKFDKLLRIKTSGRDDLIADGYRYPYEPTPYCVLERLVDSGYITSCDTVLDYGCGKGRVGLFLAYRTKAKTIGIEYDERMYRHAEDNLKNCAKSISAEFVHTRAEEYEVACEVNRCYFFNPFSAEILHKVMARIMESYYSSPREIMLFFYYPSEEYISSLMSVDQLEYVDDIPCGDLFDPDNTRERIAIFKLPTM